LAKKTAKTEAPAPIDLSDLTAERLAQAVFDGLGTKLRQEMPLNEIRAVADKLIYRDKRSSRPAPVLMVKKLLFKGTKTLAGQDTKPIDYQQEFAPGVNIILIEQNLVGKSSILKTIKFALTGDHEEYDQAVREWIKEIWLQFSLGTRDFTVLLAEKEDAWHGLLVSRTEDRPFDEVVEALPRKDQVWVTLEKIREGLAAFFSNEYSLGTLGWTIVKTGGEIVPQAASWQTYFQALRIKDDDHDYLLCESVAGLAGQAYILATAFLGLHLAEPLNQLGVQNATLKKTKQRDEAEVARLNQEKTRLQEERRTASQRVEEIQQVQAERRRAVLAGDLPDQIATADSDLVQTMTQIKALQQEQQNLASLAQQERAQAKRLRTLAQLQREFTGLEVTYCPRCSKGIAPALITREGETHQCRLCNKTAEAAAPEDVEHFEIEAKECESRAAAHQRGHTEAGKQITTLQKTENQQRQRADLLRQSIQGGITAALPKPEEEEEKTQKSERVGNLNHQISLIDKKLAEMGDGSNPERQAKIVKRVRERLKEEAGRRNTAINVRLNELAQGVIAALGADQITGVKVSPLGDISLEKNGADVPFGGIKNPGERFRVKLALFLAMMQLGREKDGGRHPGFLLIDQLGAAEMVPGNLLASAKVYRSIDTNFGKQVQIICCTAKPEFREATQAVKIYGHKVNGPQGQQWVF